MPAKADETTKLIDPVAHDAKDAAHVTDHTTHDTTDRAREAVMHGREAVAHATDDAKHWVPLLINRLTCGLYLHWFYHGLDKKMASPMTPVMHASWFIEDAVRQAQTPLAQPDLA